MSTEFLDLHDHYSKDQSLDGIKTIITYVNGNLSLWIKKADNSIDEHQICATPSLGEDYKITKLLPHITVSLSLIVQNIVKNKEKSIRNIKDLGLIARQLDTLRTIVTKDPDALMAIEKNANYLHKINVETSIQKILCLEARYQLEITPINDALTEKGAQIQTQGMHAIISQWLSENNIQLNKTRVLIACSKGPRKKLLEKQYMQWVYSEQGIIDTEQHIITVEMLPEQIATVTGKDLVAFLKKQHLNRGIGKKLLGNSEAMDEDVLGKYVPNALSALCPVLNSKVSSCRDSLFSQLKPIPGKVSEARLDPMPR